jgi:hypothetical protein
MTEQPPSATFNLDSAWDTVMVHLTPAAEMLDAVAQLVRIVVDVCQQRDQCRRALELLLDVPGVDSVAVAQSAAARDVLEATR